MIHVTLYRGAQVSVPQRQDDFDTWEECADALEDLIRLESPAPKGSDRETQKKALFAFAPHRLSAPRRLLANVTEVSLLVLDVDKCNLDALVQAVADCEIDALVYTSPSDNPRGPADERRARVVAPLDEPLTADECRHARFAFAEALGLEPGCGVEGAKDAAKLFFAGKYHNTPDREVWRFKAPTE